MHYNMHWGWDIEQSHSKGWIISYMYTRLEGK